MLRWIKKTGLAGLEYIERITKIDMVYLTKGGFWLTLGQTVTSLSSFALAVAFAHFLPRQVYGDYKYVLSIIGIITVLTLPLMITALTQAMARGYEGTIRPAVKAKMRWGLLASLACLGTAAYYYWQGNFPLVAPFVIAAFFMPFMDTFELYQSYLQGKKRFDDSSKYRIYCQMIAIVCMLGAVVFSQKLPVIVLTYFLSWTVSRFIFQQYVIRRSSLNSQVDASTVGYGKHLSLMNVISTIAAQADKLLVFHFLGANELAIYAIAIAPPEQIKGLLSQLDTLYFPKFATKTAAEAKKIFKARLLPLAILGIVVIGAYILCARFLFSVFFPKYMDAVIYSQIFAVSMLNLALFPASTFLRAKSKVFEQYVQNLATPLFQIASMLLLTYWYGLFGLIIARILTRFLGSILSVMLFYRAFSEGPEPTSRIDSPDSSLDINDL